MWKLWKFSSSSRRKIFNVLPNKLTSPAESTIWFNAHEFRNLYNSANLKRSSVHRQPIQWSRCRPLIYPKNINNFFIKVWINGHSTHHRVGRRVQLMLLNGQEMNGYIKAKGQKNLIFTFPRSQLFKITLKVIFLIFSS